MQDVLVNGETMSEIFVIAMGNGRYLATNDDDYCLVTTDKDEATRFRAIPNGTTQLFQFSGRYDDGRYLGAAGDGAVQIYQSSSGCGWSLQNGKLTDEKGRALLDAVSGQIVTGSGAKTNPATVELIWPWDEMSHWMEDVRRVHKTQLDKLPLFQFPLPGSHDSGTYGTDWSMRTQHCTITEQLRLGVRFFDLRVRVDSGDFYISHYWGTKNRVALWPAPSNLQSLPCILLDFRNFLAANPGETLILKLQNFDGYGGQDFNEEDHRHLRALLAMYLPLLAPTSPQSLLGVTVGAARGRAIAFYQLGGKSEAPGTPNSEWDAIWPYLLPTDQATESECIRLWDPYWDDAGHGIADEPGDDPKTPPTYLTDTWKDYHLGNLWAWQAMGSARFFVAQCQMQPANGTPSKMIVDGYFSKVERSAIFNNHLNVDMFGGWLSGIPLQGQPSRLRPNVMTLDFVEYGGLARRILGFFLTIPPGQLAARYPTMTGFRDGGGFRMAFDNGAYLALGSNGWVVFDSDVSKALTFTVKVVGDDTYYMVQDGDWDGYFLSLNSSYCVGLFKSGSDGAWRTGNGLHSIYSKADVGAAASGAYLYANAQGSVPQPRLDWI